MRACSAARRGVQQLSRLRRTTNPCGRGAPALVQCTHGGPAATAAQHSTSVAAQENGSGGDANNSSAEGSAPDPIFYSAFPLDRAAHLRSDAAALSRLLADPAARLLPVSGARVLVRDGRGPPQAAAAAATGEGGLSLAWVAPAAEAVPSLDPDVPPLFLGLDASGAPHFGGQVSRAAGDALAGAVTGSRWAVARTAGPALSPGDAAIAATACGLAQWHAANLHSSATGERTAGTEGGFARAVPSTGRSVYPRIDPAIITLVTAGDWALLGRKAEWPAGRYSTLAGFLEVGETLEQALAREVAEESAVAVAPGSIRYVASQPWPFPRSLMVGFRAQAAAAWGAASAAGPRGLDLLEGPARAAAMGVGIRREEIDAALLPASRLPRPVPQPGEMEDVRWFHRDWMRAAAAAVSASAAAAGDATNGGDDGTTSSSGNGGGGGGSGSHGADNSLGTALGFSAGPGAQSGGFGGFEIPGSYSLAHKLITEWLGEGQANSSSAAAAAAPWAGDLLPQVSIGTGVFKYVLMRVHDSGDDGAAVAPRSKLLVWGHPAADYHNHIYQRARAAASRLGLQCDVLGGGRMEHSPEAGSVSVYGYSAAFGPAPHEVAAALLLQWFPFYGHDGVTVSYDGY